jgi:hypothetical protein
MPSVPIGINEAHLFDKLADAASLLGIPGPTFERPSEHSTIQNFNECLRRLLHEDPTKRPSIQQVKLTFAFYSLLESAIEQTWDLAVFHAKFWQV